MKVLVLWSNPDEADDARKLSEMLSEMAPNMLAFLRDSDPNPLMPPPPPHRVIVAARAEAMEAMADYRAAFERAQAQISSLAQVPAAVVGDPSYGVGQLSPMDEFRSVARPWLDAYVSDRSGMAAPNGNLPVGEYTYQEWFTDDRR